MSDQIEKSPWITLVEPGWDSASVVGKYLVERTGLNADKRFHIKLVERVEQSPSGAYVSARVVDVDGNGQIVRKSPNVKLLGILPLAFYDSPSTAQAICERAERALENYLSAYRVCKLKGPEFHAFCDEHEAKIARILTGEMA